ncbi:hypothetical protein [Actinocrispum wychmicini]|uniref:Capsid maturation protease n=1 Tax=Actinocrispum wychmicini TaxID=1213861 RepID=A0A4V2S6U0_9PSEU|nr:hypothetical protein [Actinocrispum wychmicini]TCO56900.1 hypothetical protein EV192_106375 [Actinocrispum wychmicini]
MTAEDYALAQAVITAALVATVQRLLTFFRIPGLSLRDWFTLLDLLYPYVEEARTRSAELARRFYDQQRNQHHPDEPRHDLFLAEYRPDWFREAMEPVRTALSRPGASQSAVAEVALRAATQVENGGRRTQLRAVDSDPAVVGWARVATGRETCAFCLMLVSRGPVYVSAEGAGLDTDDTSAHDLIAAGDKAALDEVMTRWHPGCDCKVVPVFNRADWPGRDAFVHARRIWAEHTQGHTGTAKLNAFRRALDSGIVDIPAMSLAA